MQIAKYGTYGFMSLILGAQLALIPQLRAADTDRVLLDAKKKLRTNSKMLKPKPNTLKKS